jgi:hypothetical protein
MGAGVETVHDLLEVKGVRRADLDGVRSHATQHLLVVLKQGDRRQLRIALAEARLAGLHRLDSSDDLYLGHLYQAPDMAQHIVAESDQSDPDPAA